MPKVFIIIVNWNGWKDTMECIKSLEGIHYPNFEVVLVDNGSIEKLKIQNSKFKITQIFNEKNLGFAGGNNVGIKYVLRELGIKNQELEINANNEYILLLNNDTIVDPNFLGELVRAEENNKNFGILGPKIYYFDEPNRVWSAGGMMNWFTGNTHLEFNKLKEENNATRKDLVALMEYISGCAMLVRRGVFEKIGLLYEPYFLYYEDVDFCLRARGAGFQCALAPNAKIWHKVSQSTKTLGNPVFHYYNHRNILLLAKRNRPLFFYLAMIPWSIWKFGKQLFKLIFRPSTKQISLAIMRGIEDFYKGNFGQKL